MIPTAILRTLQKITATGRSQQPIPLQILTTVHYGCSAGLQIRQLPIAEQEPRLQDKSTGVIFQAPILLKPRLIFQRHQMSLSNPTSIIPAEI